MHTSLVVVSSIEAVKDCNFGSYDGFNHRPLWLKNACESFAPGIAFRGVDDYLENRYLILTVCSRRIRAMRVRILLEHTINK